MIKRALICGISGQDGAYLARHLLSEGYSVTGTSRDAQICSFRNLKILGIFEHINLESMVPTDFRSVINVINKAEPCEIYNLAGQSSVALSFLQPAETLESITLGTLNLLEAIRFTSRDIRFYNACSSDSFGDTGGSAADESTPFRPRSPYGVAKAAAYWQTVNYRESYGLRACSGILFNHESPLRPARFVLKKLIDGAQRISVGLDTRLVMGNLGVVRDWGWAPEFVVAMWKMLQTEEADDFVIATGKSFSLQEVVSHAFQIYDLDWKKYVITDESFKRPSDIQCSRGNPEKAKQKLGWKAEVNMHEMILRLSKKDKYV